jgi:hypothetical protein
LLNKEGIVGIKGEFEAEGLSRIQVASEKIICLENNLSYTVKIGGCEARGDISFLQQMNIKSIVAPMIESGFAMSKYMDAVDESFFNSIGVTIETIQAVENIEEILNFGKKITEVTVGRSDLSSSFGEKNVNSEKITELTLKVASEAKKRNLKFTLGGSIGDATIKMLNDNPSLLDCIDRIETRKCILDKDLFMKSGLLNTAFSIEKALLENKNTEPDNIIKDSKNRIKELQKRS